jgi:hypothetical protein
VASRTCMYRTLYHTRSIIELLPYLDPALLACKKNKKKKIRQQNRVSPDPRLNSAACQSVALINLEEKLGTSFTYNLASYRSSVKKNFQFLIPLYRSNPELKCNAICYFTFHPSISHSFYCFIRGFSCWFMLALTHKTLLNPAYGTRSVDQSINR